MNIATQHNIGTFVDVVTSVVPQAATASVNGAGIDRQAHDNPLSCLLHTALGADTGTPTSFSVQSKIQDSADNSTFADYTDPATGAVAQAAALTAASTENALAVDLGNARRYIRVVTTISFTGGTSPSIEVAADLILGGEDTLPAT